MSSVKETKLYDILGVAPTASTSEIKKAYLQKAKLYHPDRNPGSEDKFKEISNAHEILSDSEKRDTYDRYGEDGLKEGGGRGGHGFDFFSEIFGMGRPGGGGRGSRRGEDIVHRMPVNLEDLYNGKETKLALRKNIVCPDCEGKGSSKPNAVQPCADCKGHGVRVTLRQVGPGMVQQLQTECPKCNGVGEIIKEKDRCKKCDGNKVVQEKKILEIYIEKGMLHKQKLTFSGEGDQEPNVIPGDVIILLTQEEHKMFTRDGADLIMQKDITLVEALCGFTFTITHLDGRLLLVKSVPGEVIKPGDVREIANEGMPIHKRPFDKGSLIIKFSVKFPETIGAEQAQMLAKVLPEPAPLPQLNMADVEEVTLQAYGTSNQGHRGKRKEVYDADDAPQGGVGCAQQ